jgi:cytochrome c-type biogenesis protein CcmH
MRYVMGLLAMLALMVAASNDGALAATTVRTTVQEVGEGLTCQCGCGLTVANCNHPSCGFAIPTRGNIAAMINKGMSRLQILQSFRSKYGEKVLSAPTTEGFNLLAWVMPYVAVGAGVLLILVAVARWRKPQEAGRVMEKPVVALGGDQFEAGLRQRLERDLRRQL